MKCPNCDYEPMHETKLRKFMGAETGVVIFECHNCRVSEVRSYE